MIWITFCLLCLIGLLENEAKQKILHGRWTLYGTGINVSVHAKQGLDSYSMLWRAGLIKDPLTGTHDMDYRWIANRNWTFIHSFRWNRKIPPYTTVELIWDEVDTFCQVTLNGHVLPDRINNRNDNNSFLPRSWLIGDWIRIGRENHLSLECASTNQMARLIAYSLRPREPPPPKCWPQLFRGECYINLVRTTQASFGWDWGPAFPIQGFWQLPKIVLAYRGLRFGSGFRLFTTAVTAETSPQAVQLWSADASVEVRLLAPPARVVRRFCIWFSIDELRPHPERRCYRRYRSTESEDVPITLFTNQSGVIPWWPNGIATGPYTYTMHLNLTTSRGLILDRAKHVIGFREFELHEEHIWPHNTSAGMSFYFRVNGIPVFAKGANWIPSRLLPGRAVGFMNNRGRKADAGARQLLISAAAAGINVIRVWGGGRYEPDWFYEEADRLGLMIWHDMMFAVATYAGRENGSTGSDTVEREVGRQIRRLHSHPSIVIWATDNEVKQAVNDGWYAEPRDSELLQAFKDRFVDSIARVVNAEERPKFQDLQLGGFAMTQYRPRRCLISSPSNGLQTEWEKGMDFYPQNPRFGDVHYYTYSGNFWSEENYPLTRFTSEFGIQSIPTPLAWKRSLASGSSNLSDWDINGPLMSHRQHHSSGETLFSSAATHIGKPKKVSDPIAQYSRWAYLTQLNQLMSYRTHINLLMRHQCRLNKTQEQFPIPWERTSMGAIYWQLNDVWAAPTWSTIDAAGQWKMAHYGAVRECFSNHPAGRLSAQIPSGHLQVDWIPPVQPDQEARRHAADQLWIRCLTIDSFQPTFEWFQKIDWPLYNLTCPVMIFSSFLHDVVNKCKFGDTLRAKTLLQLALIQNETGVIKDGSTVILLDLPAKIDRWPSGSGREGIRIVDLIPIDPAHSSQSHYTIPLEVSAAFHMRLLSQSPELFIWLELDPNLNVEYWFDKNAFHILDQEGQEVNLFVSSPRHVTADLIRSNIRFHSLSTIHQS